MDTLPKELFIAVSGFGGEYFLSDYFCPKCGNQTMYYLGNQVVAYACVNCHTHWQIRTNEKPSLLDDVLFQRISLDDDLIPNWGDV